jgi:hypothetical protein
MKGALKPDLFGVVLPHGDSSLYESYAAPQRM